MKCDHCGNEMVWKGSMHSGELVCERCESDEQFEYDMATQVVCAGGSGGSAATNPNVMTCQQSCSMRGGSGWCACFGEPSCLKAPSSVFGDWDKYQKAMEKYIKDTHYLKGAME